jgi:hypothetical protein
MIYDDLTLPNGSMTAVGIKATGNVTATRINIGDQTVPARRIREPDQC